MTAPSTGWELVPVSQELELFDETARYRRASREEREKRRAKRDHRARIAAIATTAGLVVAALCFAVAGVLTDGAQVSAQPNDTPVEVVAPAPPPVPPALPDPVAVDTTPTTTPWMRWGVQLPGGEVEGWLITDGVRADKVIPGQVGRSILSIPVDPTSAATFNLGDRQWRVTERGQVRPDGLKDIVNANAQVPTAMLVGRAGNPLLPWVIGR